MNLKTDKKKSPLKGVYIFYSVIIALCILALFVFNLNIYAKAVLCTLAFLCVCIMRSLKNAQIHALLFIVWFEGVYGEQRTWENLMGELTRFVQIQRLPVQGLLRRFEFDVDVLKYVGADLSAALRRSAGWIRQYLCP